MAQPTTAKFGKMLIELGDDAEPPVYAAPCGFTSKGVTISKNLQEVNIPDCDNPDDPIWVGRDVQSQSATITGDGVAAAESVPDWDDAAMSTDSVPMRVTLPMGTRQLWLWTAEERVWYALDEVPGPIPPPVQGNVLAASIFVPGAILMPAQWQAPHTSCAGRRSATPGMGRG